MVRRSGLGAGACRVGQLGVEQLGLQVGEAFVEKAIVGSGGVQLLLQAPVVVGELAYALLERGVLLSEALRGAFGVLGLRVGDLPEEDADPFPLGVNLDVGGLEGVLGVKGTLAPRRFDLRVVCGLGSAAATVP